ncbi:DNA-binding protein [Actinomycetota bacterium]|nr:DNA-binding protein [Actinomycetota bacterium]
MLGEYFVDTNVILYAFSASDQSKRDVAQSLLIEGNPVISSQVISEFSNVSSTKYKLSTAQIINYIDDIVAKVTTVPVSFSIAKRALQIKDRYKLSFYDSQIIAAAIASGCTTLYTEDLSNGQIINETLQIVNPFKDGENSDEK